MSSCICIGGLIVLADSAAWVLSAQSGDGRWVVYITSGTTVVVAFCGALILIAPHIGRAITTLGSSIMPALAEIHKQREEMNKGSLSAQIAELKKSLEDKADDLADTQRKAALDLAEANQRASEALAAANRKASDALAEAQRKAEAERADIDRVHTTSLEALRKNLHNVRDQMQNDALRRELDIQGRDEKIARLEKKVTEMQAEEARLLAIIADRQEVQSKAIDQTQAVIANNTAKLDAIAASQSSPEIPVVRNEGGKTAG